MPRIKINGKDIEVAKGTTILQACLANGVFVPHYCWHPGLSIAGNCRMCLVKVSTSKKLEASCALPVADNMVVETECDDVKAARKSVLEFMLINHPLDCPICDKAGECMLQNYTYDYRDGLSRFDKEDKVIRHTKDLGPTIKIWGNRCISCTRCVRFCDEISGTGQLTIVNRGDHSVADVSPTVPLTDPLSLNTVDLCPVGALISRDFLYQSRVWYTATTESVCPSCSRGCNVKVSVLNNEVKRLEPCYNPDVNQYWMCDEGRMNYKYISSEKRLRTAKGSISGLAESIRSIIGRYSTDGFAGVISTYQTNEELFLFKKLMDALGVTNVGFLTHRRGERQVFKGGFTIEEDGTPNRRGAEIIFGNLFSVLRSSVKGLFILNGIPNLSVPQFLASAVERAENEEGTKCFVAVCDIMENDLTRRAEIVLPGASWVEKDGTFINCDGRIQRIRKCVDASYPVRAEVEQEGATLLSTLYCATARPEIETLQEILVALKVREQVLSAEGVFKEMAREVKEFGGLEYGRIGANGVNMKE